MTRTRPGWPVAASAARRVRRSAASTASRAARPSTQQHRPGLGQRDGAAGAVQQRHAEPPFELPDRPRQRRLRDPEPLRGPPEVQLLGDGDEVPQLPRLHATTTLSHTRGVSLPTRSVLELPPRRAQDRVHERDRRSRWSPARTRGSGTRSRPAWAPSAGASASAPGTTSAGRPPWRSCARPGSDAFGVPLDVTDDASVAAAAELIEERAGRLDVLVNNAGITGGMPQEPDHGRPRDRADGRGDQRDRRHPRHQRDAAAAAPLGVAADREHVQQRRLPHPADRLAGERRRARSPPPTRRRRRSSTPSPIQYAKELRDTNILINAACPGYVATDLNGFRGVRTPEQGAAIAIRLATLPDDGPTGGFFEDAGVVPW